MYISTRRDNSEEGQIPPPPVGAPYDSSKSPRLAAGWLAGWLAGLFVFHPNTLLRADGNLIGTEQVLLPRPFRSRISIHPSGLRSSCEVPGLAERVETGQLGKLGLAPRVDRRGAGGER